MSGTNSYWIAYVATNGPANSRSTRVVISETVIEAPTEGVARSVLHKTLRAEGFTKIRVTRTKIMVKT